LLSFVALYFFRYGLWLFSYYEIRNLHFWGDTQWADFHFVLLYYDDDSGDGGDRMTLKVVMTGAGDQ
jgi:hypothetical protein